MQHSNRYIANSQDFFSLEKSFFAAIWSLCPGFVIINNNFLSLWVGGEFAKNINLKNALKNNEFFCQKHGPFFYRNFGPLAMLPMCRQPGKVGAMPGKVIQCLKKTQTSNPLILIDEDATPTVRSIWLKGGQSLGVIYFCFGGEYSFSGYIQGL